jgi:hypothetical protein
MTNWRRTVPVKDLLDCDENDSEAQRVGKAVHERISNEPVFWGFNSGRFLAIKTVGDLNCALDKMYDFADRECIWIS